MANAEQASRGIFLLPNEVFDMHPIPWRACTDGDIDTPEHLEQLSNEGIDPVLHHESPLSLPRRPLTAPETPACSSPGRVYSLSGMWSSSSQMDAPEGSLHCFRHGWHARIE